MSSQLLIILMIVGCIFMPINEASYVAFGLCEAGCFAALASARYVFGYLHFPSSTADHFFGDCSTFCSGKLELPAKRTPKEGRNAVE